MEHIRNIKSERDLIVKSVNDRVDNLTARVDDFRSVLEKVTDMAVDIATIKTLVAALAESQCPSPGLCKQVEAELKIVTAEIERAKGGFTTAKFGIGLICTLIGALVGVVASHFLK